MLMAKCATNRHNTTMPTRSQAPIYAPYADDGSVYYLLYYFISSDGIQASYHPI
jgi:hypothetical protein